MKSKNKKLLLVVCFTSFLASSCGLKAPNLRPTNPTPPRLGIGGIWTETNSKKQGEYTLEEMVRFLYAQVDDPATKNVNEAKGPATCFSSADAEAIMVFIESACVKVKCSYEDIQKVKATTGNVRALSKKATTLSTAKAFSPAEVHLEID